MNRLLLLLLGMALCTVPHGSALSADAVHQPTHGERIAPDDEPCLQWAVQVVGIEDLRHQGSTSAKLLTMGGGDPAINGLAIYLQFYVDPVVGSRIFRIGDSAGYRLISERPGHLELKVYEQDIDPKNGEVTARTRKLIVRWSIADGAEAPEEIEIASAQ